MGTRTRGPPLVVNTSGWVKGLGLELAEDALVASDAPSSTVGTSTSSILTHTWRAGTSKTVFDGFVMKERRWT